MAQVAKVTAGNFAREVFFSPVPVVVDVYADWCPPCRALAPLLERYARVYDGEVRFLKVNADEEPDVTQVYRVEGLPTLLFFHEGRLVDRVVGFPPVPALAAKLDELAGRHHRPGPPARAGAV